MTEGTRVDILVVGGGPVGLFAANLAVKYGMTVKIIDVEMEPQHWGRGDWIHGRTLEILEYNELADDLLATGAKVEQFSHHNKLQRTTTVSYVPEHVVTKYKHILCVGQHITESTLQHNLSENSVQVQRPWTVIAFQQDQNDNEYPLSATLKNMADDTEETIRCKYLLGCDGAHSSIRKQLDIAYEGEGSKKNCGVLDAIVQTNFPDRKSISFVQGPFGTNACMFPRENNLTRVMVQLSDEGDRNQIHLETVQHEARRALLPHRVEFIAVMWWTIYQVGQHVATHYTSSRDDPRIFLCGDACHSQSPTLGQGLNTGLGDVFNLKRNWQMWKIAMVNAGNAKASLLATYELERRPVAEQVIATDKLMVKATELGQEDLDAILKENQLFISGFGVTYNADGAGNAFPLTAGDRAPDFKVVEYHSGKKLRLYDTWKSYNLHFHIVILAHDLNQNIKCIADTMASLDLPPWMDVQVVTTTVQKNAIAKQLEDHPTIRPESVLIDKINQAQCHHGSIGNSKSVAAVVIRPDLHVGWIGELSELSLGFLG
ncbi:FAD binding domain-containing protein [Dichotomocladium elegans]|nr:FAD binding domain-containing protein [Dichotomocladium elegans]